MKYPQELADLVDAVLQWWDKHQFDVTADGYEEYNLYDEPPSFVVKAQNLNELLQRDTDHE